jgi:alkaline phosphatase
MFKKMRAVWAGLACLVFCFAILTGCAQTIQTADGKTIKIEQPKYVFYLIGDGLGASQRQVAEYYLRHMQGDDSAMLVMNDMAVAGINTTYSLDTLVTDSAAAGTALACGVKTNNGVIAQTADGVDTKTLVEAAEELGYATGVVTSTRITHATPAVFYAHNADRDDENSIAEDLVDSGVDFIAGGGYRNFVPSSDDASKREDNRDLVAEMASEGYTTFIGDDGAADFADYSPEAKDQVLALFSKSHMPYEVDRANSDTDLLSLSEITQKGVELLAQNKDGFFLMVEGGRIDHACHPNDLVATVYDTLEFDEVVQVAMDFYNEHPKETLIVVVGDHETGGLGLGFANDYFLNLDAIDGITASFEDNYGDVYQAGGDRDAYYEYLETIGIKDFTAEEKALIEAGMDSVDAGDTSSGYGYNPAGIAVNHIVSQRAGVQWTTYAHTGTQIPFSVMGISEEAFGGFMDNTEIAQMLAQVLSVTIGS